MSEKESEFQDTPEDWARRWAMELTSARKELEKWHRSGEKIIKRFRDEREQNNANDTRWNLFTSNIQTKRALLFGSSPRVSVARRFADAADDVGRVAGEMEERLLNADIQRDSDSYGEALQYALDDKLLPGLGIARVRYVAEFEEVSGTPAMKDPITGKVLAAEVPAQKVKTSEDVETDYVHWRDFLWSPARVWHEVRWVSFEADMGRAELVKRFGKEGELVPLNAKKGGKRGAEDDAKTANPWGRAKVHEIWDKETRSVFWYVDGHSRILDKQPDTLGLKGFFPCPRPMLANATTSSLIPRPDYALAQDLYEEIDFLSARITYLERVIRVAGLYDGSEKDIQRLIKDAGENELIPVKNWSKFTDKGGISASVQWLPLEAIVNAMNQLRDYRRELVDNLHQQTGMADIMRGQASQPGATATEQRAKTKFGSVRIQAEQADFARFASDLQRLKAEIIAKLFDEQTILERCNCQFTPDAQLAPEAVKLIKSRWADYRIEVKPESVSIQDFAALKEERMEVLAGVAGFISSMGPLVQQIPASSKYMLQILQWSLSGLRGGAQMEGILDQAIHAAQMAEQQAAANPQAQQPDPKIIAMQMKGQQEMAKEQTKLQGDLVRLQAETEAKKQQEANQMTSNIREAQAKAQIGAANRLMQPPKPGVL